LSTKVDIKKKAMIEALTASLGIVTNACKAVGIDRTSHYNWMHDDPEYKAAVESIADIALDFAESRLHKSIQGGSDTATIFYLKTKGKKRGYIERQEIDGTINHNISPITIDFGGVEEDKGNEGR
jgi:hypothetical protein